MKCKIYDIKTESIIHMIQFYPNWHHQPIQINRIMGQMFMEFVKNLLNQKIIKNMLLIIIIRDCLRRVNLTKVKDPSNRALVFVCI